MVNKLPGKIFGLQARKSDLDISINQKSKDALEDVTSSLEISNSRSQSHWHDGFVMIETVAALGICSIFTMYLLSMILSMRNMYIDYVTDNNAKVVLNALENYVSNHGLLPYPADPVSGNEFEYPEDETEWEVNPDKYMSGIVPYNTLAIDIKYAKDGRGAFFTYIVNPVLCGRKNVINVPPGDPREAIDYKSYNPSKKVLSGNQLVQSLPCYSSFRTVRSYDPKYSFGSENTKYYVKKWDLIDQIEQASITCIYNGQKINTNRWMYLYPPKPQTKLSTIGPAHEIGCSVTSQQRENAYKFLIMGLDQEANELNQFYKITDTIAVVLISHGPYACGAFNSKGGTYPVQTNSSKEKIQNSNLSANKRQIFINKSPDSPGIFDDKVYWVSRFNLAKFRPFMVDILDVVQQEGPVQ